MDYYDKIESLRAGDAIDISIADIAEDIRGRRGIGHELEAIDDETVVEMLDEWVAIVRANNP